MNDKHVKKYMDNIKQVVIDFEKFGQIMGQMAVGSQNFMEAFQKLKVEKGLRDGC